MQPRLFLILITGAALLAPLSAQTFQQRAVIRGGGSPDRGKCTIEVVVDGAAEVEIRGDRATLRNLSGQPPQWRRFECNAVMPTNPPNFRFAGVDGRGRQDLVRDPRNGGAAVVRIEDRDNGSEGYTFDVMWDNGPGGGYGPGGPGYGQGGPGGYPQGSQGPGYGRDRRFTTEQAVQVCQDSIRQQASDRFRTSDIRFRRTNIDDGPNRRDWVVGSFEVRRFNRDETYRFSCSVNFDNGRVRSATIEEPVGGGSGQGYNDRGRRGVEECRRAVAERVRANGGQVLDFARIDVDDRPGRNDRVVGTVRTDRRGRSADFEFSCSVDLASGIVRSVDLRF